MRAWSVIVRCCHQVALLQAPPSWTTEQSTVLTQKRDSMLAQGSLRWALECQSSSTWVPLGSLLTLHRYLCAPTDPTHQRTMGS